MSDEGEDESEDESDEADPSLSSPEPISLKPKRGSGILYVQEMVLAGDLSMLACPPAETEKSQPKTRAHPKRLPCIPCDPQAETCTFSMQLVRSGAPLTSLKIRLNVYQTQLRSSDINLSLKSDL